MTLDLPVNPDATVMGAAVGLAAALQAPLGIAIQQHIDSYRYISAVNEQVILCTDTAIATLREAYAARSALAAGCVSGVDYLRTLDPAAVDLARRLTVKP